MEWIYLLIAYLPIVCVLAGVAFLIAGLSLRKLIYGVFFLIGALGLGPVPG